MAIITLNNNALSSVTELPSGISGQNYPAFFAYKDADSTLSDATWTKVICNVETLDTDSAYNTATGEYTFTTSGKYCVFFNAFGKADKARNKAANRTKFIGKAVDRMTK